MLSDIWQRLNWVDVAVFILLVRSLYVGARRGLVLEVTSLVGILLAVIIAAQHSENVATLLSEWVHLPPSWLGPICIGFLFVATWVVFWMIRGLLGKLFGLKVAAGLDRWGGMLVGGARGAVIASLVLVVLTHVPAVRFAESIRERSLSGPYLMRVVPWIYQVCVQIYPFRTESETDKILMVEN